jgi:hypothetical protein
MSCEDSNYGYERDARTSGGVSGLDGEGLNVESWKFEVGSCSSDALGVLKYFDNLSN